MKRIPILIVLLIALAGSLKSQDLVYSTEFYQILDNREYFSIYGTPQTILGARLNAMGGIQLDSNNCLQVGFNYMYEYGAPIDGVPVQLNLFYSFKNEKIDFYFGAFPRKDLLEYPLALLTDTLLYYRPNIEGGFAQYNWNWGHVNAWADWVGRQAETTRESFLAGLSGNFNYKILYLDYYIYMHHLAGDLAHDFHIRDNAGVSSYAGFNFSSLIPFMQTLSVDFGFIRSIDRTRPEPYGYETGLSGRLKINFKRFGVDITHYQGGSLSLGYGDQLYSSGNYTRFEAFIIPFKSKYVSSRFNINTHLIKGEINTSQQFFLFVNFGGSKPLKKPKQ